MVERETGRIRSAVLAAIEHVDQRLADLGPRAVLLEQDTGDAAHGSCSSEKRATMGEPLGIAALRSM
jgi:hypothetical protein